MNVIFNAKDDMWYGNKADREADTTIVKNATAKFMELDTGDIYISDGTKWVLL